MDDWFEKCYAIKNSDGGVSIVSPADNYEGDFVQWLKDVELDDMEFVSLFPIQLPADRYFRDAWRLVDSRVEIDLSAAKEIRINRLREARNRQLRDLDRQFIECFEKVDRDRISEIVIEKQQLRDMPNDDIFNTEDIDELKCATPSYLHIC
jgi:hypothetical protein